MLCFLSLRQIRIYGLVSRATYRATKSFLAVNHNVDDILARFMPVDCIPYFRTVQETTKTLIGGSTALQLFARCSYGNSDLDLYVDTHNVVSLTTALDFGLGCREIPRDRAPDADDDLLYLSCGVVYVQNFRSPTGRCIQVITTQRAPIHTILRYHSSKCSSLSSTASY